MTDRGGFKIEKPVPSGARGVQWMMAFGEVMAEMKLEKERLLDSRLRDAYAEGHRGGMDVRSASEVRDGSILLTCEFARVELDSPPTWQAEKTPRAIVECARYDLSAGPNFSA